MLIFLGFWAAIPAYTQAWIHSDSRATVLGFTYLDWLTVAALGLALYCASLPAADWGGNRLEWWRWMAWISLSEAVTGLSFLVLTPLLDLVYKPLLWLSVSTIPQMGAIDRQVVGWATWQSPHDSAVTGIAIIALGLTSYALAEGQIEERNAADSPSTDSSVGKGQPETPMVRTGARNMQSTKGARRHRRRS
jgi:hypothetical protein